jgi:ribosomal-protein-alanine N-acetyltransferase
MLFNPFPALETERLMLREMTLSDKDDLFTMRADPLMHVYTDTKPDESVEQTSVFIGKMLKGVAENRWIMWAIEHKGTNRVIGLVGIWNIDETKKTAELSYGIAPAYQGKGYMAEALTCALTFGFQSMQLAALEAYTGTDNTPSRKLLEGLRFQQVDQVDDLSEDGKRVYHMVVYRLERQI